MKRACGEGPTWRVCSERDDATTNGSLCKHHHYNRAHTEGTFSILCVANEKKMVEFHLHIHFQFFYLSIVCPDTI